MDTNVRAARPLRALAWLALAALVASPLLVALTAQAAAKTVRMVDGAFFEPQDTYLQRNTNSSVKWRNDDPNFTHNVTFENGSYTRDVTYGQTSDAKTFNGAGTYWYYCSRHGSPHNSAGGVGMFGRVIVNSTGQPPPEPSPSVTATSTVGGSSSPKPKKTKTPSSSPKPSSTPTASASPMPTPTETPTPTPTETLQSSSPIPTFAQSGGGDEGSNNVGAVAAIVVVVVLGGAGFLVYRRFIASP